MSRLLFWDEGNTIVNEIIYKQNECRYKTNRICFNNKAKMLGKKCHYDDKCECYKMEDNE